MKLRGRLTWAPGRIAGNGAEEGSGGAEGGRASGFRCVLRRRGGPSPRASSEGAPGGGASSFGACV